MTNYLPALLAVALLSTAACADDKSAPAAKPVAAAAKPATPATTAAPAGAVTALPHYAQAVGGTLTFSFMQAGAESHGAFRKFSTTFDYDEHNLAASALDVKVDIASLDTQDPDRDSTLASSDFFDSAKFASAGYAAHSLVKRADGGLDAVGKLTIRGITKDLRVPLTVRATGTGIELSGAVTFKRLDFGLGQGEWQATDTVGDAVKVEYKVPLTKVK